MASAWYFVYLFLSILTSHQVLLFDLTCYADLKNDAYIDRQLAFVLCRAPMVIKIINNHQLEIVTSTNLSSLTISFLVVLVFSFHAPPSYFFPLFCH